MWTCPRIRSRENNVNKWLRTFTSKQETNNGEPLTENGVTQVVCEIGQVPIWSSDLKLLPNIEQCDILFIEKVWLEWWYDRLKLYKNTTEMLYLLPTLPSIRFTQRNTAPVLRKLNGPFHFYREWRCIYIHVRRCYPNRK